MVRGGRPPHLGWKNGTFKKVFNKEGKLTGAYCTICEKTLANTAQARMNQHKEQCVRTSTFAGTSDVLTIDEIELVDAQVLIISTYPTELDSVSVKETRDLLDEPDTLSSQAITSDKSKNIQKIITKGRKRNIAEYVGLVTPEEKENCDSLLAKLIYGCNLSVDLVQSIHFINYTKALRPGYQPPTVKKLSNDLLLHLHDHVEATAKYSNADGILVVKTNNQDDLKSFLFFIRTQNQKMLYLKKLTCQTGSFDLTQIIIDAISLSMNKFKVIIYAVIINDDLELIDTYKLPDIWWLGCNYSIIQEIETRFISDELIEQTKLLLSKFMSKETSALLRTNGGTEIILDENLTGQVFSLISTCNKNFKAISDVVMKRLIKLDSVTKELLITDVFEEKINYYYDLMQPLLLILDKCKEPEVLMADIIEEWLKLESNSQYDFIKPQINKILTPILLICNLLHPTYKVQRFINDQKRMNEIMILLIDSIGQKGVEELGFYLGGKIFFAKVNITQNYSLSSYWNTITLIYPTISNFANKILLFLAVVPSLKSCQVNIDKLTTNRIDKRTEIF
ncbi:uncharacterized protein LOC122849185 [Aphidius gifuensis]|uniref:uncharacterized protein LOC122849185 n=1 Tax=Aphidius gifuensis TaxID=684658 RepID=UPI001CDC5B81|nr:uncharacterized protein LOC122849185 [Aphidius gifuensis]